VLVVVGVTAGLGALANLAAAREQRVHAAKVNEYDARSFPESATLGPGEAATGFVFFSPDGPPPSVTAALAVRIEDLPGADDEEAIWSDAPRPPSPRELRIRLQDRAVVRAGTAK
jgi:hypothetical protein